MYTVNAEEYKVWLVRFSYRLRGFLAALFHFFLKTLRRELRGFAEHSTLISNATYSPWQVDADFCRVLKIISSYTLLDKMRLYELWQLSNQVSHLPGDVIEVGCWRGGAGCLIAYRILQEKKETQVYLCDTFSGIVKAGSYDTFYHGGELANSDHLDVVNLSRKMELSNVTILEGIFPEETGSVLEHHLFKFVHIDVDVYESAVDAFEWLFPKLVHGGIVVFDDYGSASTPGIRRCIDELQGRSDLIIIRNLNGQAVVVKRQGNRALA